MSKYLKISAAMALIGVACGGDPPRTEPTDNPDRVWCFIEATQCALLGQDSNGEYYCQEIATNEDGSIKWIPQHGDAGVWSCFDHTEQSAEAECAGICNGLDPVRHPPPAEGEANCRARLHPHEVNGDEPVHLGECINDVGQSMAGLSLLPGPALSPDVDVSLTGSGSVTIDDSTQFVSLSRAYASIKAADLRCQNSPPGECRVRINTIAVEYANFPFAGRTIRHLTVVLAGPVDALAVPIAGTDKFLFSLLPGTVFHASGLIDDVRNTIVVESRSALVGEYDAATGTVTLSIDFVGSAFDTSVQGTVFATSDEVYNLAPHTDAGLDITMDAVDASCSAEVMLDGSGTSDVNGDLDLLLWSLDSITIGQGLTPGVVLPIGEHLITLEAFDAAGAMSLDQVTVLVVDKTLPEFVNPEPGIRLRSCEPGPSELPITPPEAMNLCSPDTPAVSGRVISINGQAVSIAITDGTVQLPAGTSQIEWTATNANGSVTFVQTVEVAAEPTLFASGELSVGKRVQVLADGVGFGTAMSTGTQRTRLGPDMEVGDVYTLPDIKVLDRATIHGTLHHAGAVQLGSGVSIGATIFDADFWQPQVPALPEFAGGAAIDVASGRAASAPAGSYGNVVVKSRARLRLSSGVYTFDALDLHGDAALEVPADGSARVYVKDALSFRGTVKTSLDAAAPLYLGYAGTSNATIAAPFRGVILAPNARLVLAAAGADRQYSGRFYARQLDVRPAARVMHDALWCTGGAE